MHEYKKEQLSFFKKNINKLYFLIILCAQFIFAQTIFSRCHSENDWKEVSITYFYDFPEQNNEVKEHVQGCFTAFKAPSGKGLQNIPVLRCKERIYLLRPASTVKKWKKIQDKNGFIEFSFPEFGINRVTAKMTKITNFSESKARGDTGKTLNSNRVIGIFIRHAVNVKKYGFKEEETGRVITVNVTDNHRFYVKNKHAFVSIKEISPEDKMLTTTGNTVRILCHADKLNDCGRSYLSGHLSLVYNMEVNHRHTYFIGSENILVHNNCSRVKRKIYYDREKTKLKYHGGVNKSTKKLDGIGVAYHENGNVRYRGKWSNNRFHGVGTSYDEVVPGRKLYEGYYHNGEAAGIGTLYNKDTGARHYYGAFLNGMFSGEGTLYYPNGNIRYKGGFFRGRKYGFGVLFDGEGIKAYEGLWLNDSPEGFGTEFDNEGNVAFRGMWKNGEKHGEGMVYDRNRKAFHEGIWCHGIYCG